MNQEVLPFWSFMSGHFGKEEYSQERKFHELLLSELRMVIHRPGELNRLTDELLCEAVTL